MTELRAAEQKTEFDTVCNLGRFHTHPLPAAGDTEIRCSCTAERTAGDQREEKVN